MLDEDDFIGGEVEDDPFKQVEDMHRDALRANIAGIMAGVVTAAVTAWVAWMAVSGYVGFLPSLLIVALIAVGVGVVGMQLAALIAFLVSRGS